MPFVPYTLIYLAAGGYRSLIYLVGLILAIVACLASFLFVLACYPSEATVSYLRHPAPIAVALA